MTASDLLGEARRRRGITRAELSRAAGVARSVVTMYERGSREPTVASLESLLAATGLSLGLRPTVRELDLDRAGSILTSVLRLAGALPYRSRGLRFPTFRSRVRTP